MASNASRGAYYKGKAKQWLERRGYQVAFLERVQWIFRPGQRPIPIKRDQFGSDLLAVSGKRIIFVQVKSGETATGGSFPAARREFDKFVFPPSAQRVILAWPPKARAPRVIVVLPGGAYQELSK